MFGAALPKSGEADEQRFADLRLSKDVVEVEEGETTLLDIAPGL